MFFFFFFLKTTLLNYNKHSTKVYSLMFWHVGLWNHYHPQDAKHIHHPKVFCRIWSLPALIEQGDGFSQVLKMQPIIQLQRVHQEVFSGCCRKPDVKPESFIAQIETTPAETSTRKSTDLVLRRKRTKDCPQRKWYPLRPKRINLDT